MDVMPYALGLSAVIGGLLLAILAWHDYRNQIFKPLKAGRYYIGFVLFLVMNLFIYFGLCAFFLDIDVLQPNRIAEQLNSGSTTWAHVIQPLLLALFYHGTGMAPIFKFGGKEANAYRMLLMSFREFLKLKFAESIKIREAIAKAQVLSKLREKSSYLHSEAERQKLDTLETKWRNVQDDLVLMDSQADFLENLKKKVDKVRDNPKRTSTLEDVARGIDDRIETIRQIEIDKLRQYVVDFVLKNFKDEKEIHDLLLDLGIGGGPPDFTPKPWFALRCMFLCAAFGLLFGPLYAFGGIGSAVDYARFGAMSLGVFGLFMGLGRDIGRKIRDRILLAIVSGALAGVAGHVVWMAATGTQVGPVIVVGLAFGVVLSLLVYVFRELYFFRLSAQPRWLKWIPVRLLLTAVSGAAAFTALGVMFEPDRVHDPDFITRMLVLGVIVLWALAAGFKLFDREHKPRRPTARADDRSLPPPVSGAAQTG